MKYRPYVYLKFYVERILIYTQNLSNKLSKYQRICYTLKTTLKIKTRKEIQLKVYKLAVVSPLLYSSQSCTIKVTDIN
jgi:hypothetical protein